MTTAFEQLVGSMETQHAEVQQCASLTDLQAVRIWQSELDGYQTIGTLLSEPLSAEIADHPSTHVGASICTTDFPTAKLHYQDAEISITAEYAYRIYLSVKAVLDKGEQLV